MQQAREKCGIVDLHHLFGKKWTYALFYNINEEPLSFNELDAMADRSVNPTLLSKRLKELSEFHLIIRETKNNRVYYRLTKEGARLKQLFMEIKLLAKEMGCAIPKECKEGDCSGCKLFRKHVFLETTLKDIKGKDSKTKS
ncbi:helix-turn-helix transcriptional regulator [Candidatus Woesearchaeota archaeon]|nr:helix-turn-helix transcriptional regulator [Candidatus Woesearchaeota archaeon]